MPGSKLTRRLNGFQSAAHCLEAPISRTGFGVEKNAIQTCLWT